MEPTDQAARTTAEDSGNRDPEPGDGLPDDLSSILAEIERLSGMDAADAAEPAARLADVLGAALEAVEEER